MTEGERLFEAAIQAAIEHGGFRFSIGNLPDRLKREFEEAKAAFLEYLEILEIDH